MVRKMYFLLEQNILHKVLDIIRKDPMTDHAYIYHDRKKKFSKLKKEVSPSPSIGLYFENYFNFDILMQSFFEIYRKNLTMFSVSCHLLS